MDFDGFFIENCRKNDTERGSDGSAASGGRSDLSEWQRSTDAKALRRRRQMSGTATGQGSNDLYRTVHEDSAGHARINDHLPQQNTKRTAPNGAAPQILHMFPQPGDALAQAFHGFDFQ